MAKKTNWKTTDKRFVAFLDILGFKEKVLRNSHEEIYSELSKISSMKKRLEESTQEERISNTFADSDVYIVSFSDSIVIFSKHDSLDNFKLFTLILKTLFATAIINKIPLKGGIAHGEVSLNKSEQIYFGQPIIDAYTIEEDVNFIGVACHYSIDKYLKKNTNSNYIKNSFRFVETPLKSGNIKHNVLDFYYHLLEKDTKSKDQNEKLIYVKEIFENFYDTVSGSPRRYVDNTIKFIDKLNNDNGIQLNNSKFD